MQKKLFLVWLLFSASYALSAQTYKYNFNNTLAEAGGGGPTLTEIADGACAPPGAPGSYSNQNITTSDPPGAPVQCGPSGVKPVFDFTQNGGLSFPNSSFIGGTYTIHMLVKFNSIPGGPSGYQRIINFKNFSNDDGLYVLNDCITLGAQPYPLGPCPKLASNVFILISLVRDGGTNTVSVYTNGTPFATLVDAGNIYVPATATTPINFFVDDAGGCETGPGGSIKYLSVTNVTSTPIEVSNTFTSLCSTTLPLRLVDFTANTQNNNAVLLKWATESEENTSHFELERSTPGGSFSKITNVVTNNSLTRNNYNFVDRQPVSGTNLYRIKSFDIDGHFKYSNILKVSLGGKLQFEVFPNPAKDAITINGIKANEVVKLVNSEGKELVQKVSTGQSITMDVSKYPTGVYIVLYFDGEKMQQQKIVKQ